MAVNVYEIVTNRIIEQLEKGVIPWRKDWRGSAPMNYVSRKPYRGINTLLLPHGGEYLTFKQCKERGGKVKAKEKSHVIVFYKTLDKEDEETGEIKSIPYLKYSNVFHLSQCDGIESKLEEIEIDPNVKPIDEAQRIFDDYILRSGVNINHLEGSDRASYSPTSDTITLPIIGQFETAEGYYGTAFHEVAHSTGHKSRLGREMDVGASFGSTSYSEEELIAEIAACMIMNSANIEQKDTFENSAAYIGAWLKKLRSDNRMIVTSSSAAQKAADLVLGVETDASSAQYRNNK